MATDNRKLIEKADIAISDLSSGGYLSAQQTDEFIRLAIKQSVLLGMITVTPMRGPIEERDKIRFSGRVLKPGSEGTALNLSQRSTPNLSKYTLTSSLFKAEVRVNDEVLEDQIEHGTFIETIKAQLSDAVARDMEYVAIQGDTTSGTALLAVLDGFIKQSTSNAVAGASATLSKGILKSMEKAVPEEFETGNEKFLTCRDAILDYQDSLANRATTLGDVKIVNDDNPVYRGKKLVRIPEWVTTNPTSVILTDPANMVVGIQRKISFEIGRDVPAQTNIIVATLRFDVKYQEETAVVKATSVATA